MPELRFPENAERARERREQPDYLVDSRNCRRVLLTGAYVAWTAWRDPRIRVVGDFGCGTGGVLATARALLAVVGKIDVHLYGYDRCEAAIAKARMRGIAAKVKDIEAESVNWPDLLVLSNVLEHLEDPHRLLAQIPPATNVLICEPFEDDGTRVDDTHLWAWPREALQELCGRHHIELARCERFDHNQQVAIGVKR